MDVSKGITIVGGGLAGLTAAIHLSKIGLKVILIEKNEYPKHKVCGEYVSNEVLPYLNWLSINISELNPTQILKLDFSTADGKMIQCTLPLGGFGVSRYALDNFLYNKAIENGCEIVHDTVNDIVFENDGFIISTSNNKTITSSIVIGATALMRGARIYAEVLGGALNSGGQRGLGSLTAPNPIAVQKCIQNAITNSGIDAGDVDVINGHLTATSKDALEISNWSTALNRREVDFPYINSLKSMVGHCLSAAGSIESVAAVLQLYNGFIFPNINCEDLNPEIEAIADVSRIPSDLIEIEVNTILKASFGFGDVNGCVVLKKIII